MLGLELNSIRCRHHKFTFDFGRCSLAEAGEGFGHGAFLIVREGERSHICVEVGQRVRSLLLSVPSWCKRCMRSFHSLIMPQGARVDAFIGLENDLCRARS